MSTFAADLPALIAEVPPEHLLRHLAKWQRAFDDRDADWWEKRLAWDACTEEDLLSQLSDLDAITSENDPSLVAEVYPEKPEQRADLSSLWSDRVVHEEMVAFGHLLIPLIRAARERLQREVGPALERFSAEALADLERGLLQRLGSVIGQIAYGVFSPLRSQQRAATLSMLLSGHSDATSDGFYRSFVGYMLNGGMAMLWRQYPVAARLCATMTELWVGFVRELVTRTTADAELLGQHFGVGMPLGQVERCTIDLGDTHDEGRAVCLVRFAGGQRLVYKPRPIGLESVYEEIITWLNARMEPDLHLQAPRRLDRETYGWIEFVHNDACATEEDIERYYTRLGAALAVIYCLNGNDFHYENIIASGAHPVLIDMEALLTPRFSAEESPAPDHAVAAAADDLGKRSVLTTGLLPSYKRLAAGLSIDMGGMGGGADDEGRFAVGYWQHPHTDFMRLAYRLEQQQAKANQPTFNGERYFASAYPDAIDRGFSAAYAVFAREGSTLLAAVTPLLERQRVRFILRATSLYVSMLTKALHPTYLRHEADRALVFESLTHAFLHFDERPSAWALLEDERRSMAKMDVPMFEADCCSRDLVLADGTRLEHFFEASARDAWEERLGALGPEDLARQRSLIRLSLAGRAASAYHPPQQEQRAAVHAPQERAISQEPEAQDYARRVLASLWARRAGGNAEGAAWNTLDFDAAIGRYVLAPNLGLLSGNAGIGLFGAAVWAATGAPEASRLAQAAFAPILQVSHDDPAKLSLRPDDLRLGLNESFSGSVYALTLAAKLLQDDSYVAAALRLVSHAMPLDLASCAHQDVYGGLAGLVLGLLPLLAVSQEEQVRALCVRAGDALLQPRPAPESVWSHQSSDSLLFGAAGRSLALARLGHVTGEEAYLDAADDIRVRLHAPRSGALPETLTWATGRVGEACAALDICGSDHSFVRHVADALVEREAPEIAELTSGSLGQALFLQKMAAATGEAAYASAARARCEAALTAVQASGESSSGWGEVFLPGLYQGSPGIAYALLHLTDQADLPCLLTFSA